MDIKNTDFSAALDLMRIIQEASIMATVTQAEIDEHIVIIVGDQGHSLAAWQLKIAESEATLEALCRKHPEWFAERKRISTTYGMFKMHATSHTKIPDVESTIRKIRRNGMVKQLLRKVDHINIEAAEKLDPVILKKLGIFRVKEEKFSVTPKKKKTKKILQAMRKKQASRKSAKL